MEAKQFCYGFLAGVAQFHGAMVQGDKIQPLACPKDAVTREQLVGVFLDWAKANPQSMDELPVESLERAIRPPDGRAMHILEFNNQEQLAADQVYEFAYFLTTNAIRGTVAGTALRPVAMR